MYRISRVTDNIDKISERNDCIYFLLSVDQQQQQAVSSDRMILVDLSQY